MGKATYLGLCQLNFDILLKVSMITQKIRVEYHQIKFNGGRNLIFVFVLYFVTLMSFKTCNSFLNKVKTIFVNGIQHFYDYANRLASLKQSDNDMMSFIAKSQSIVEELKILLVVHSIIEIK